MSRPHSILLQYDGGPPTTDDEQLWSDHEDRPKNHKLPVASTHRNQPYVLSESDSDGVMPPVTPPFKPSKQVCSFVTKTINNDVHHALILDKAKSL